MEPVFRALADDSRRKLLDRPFQRDGQTLGELSASLPTMTRFGGENPRISQRQLVSLVL